MAHLKAITHQLDSHKLTLTMTAGVNFQDIHSYLKNMNCLHHKGYGMPMGWLR